MPIPLLTMHEDESNCQCLVSEYHGCPDETLIDNHRNHTPVQWNHIFSYSDNEATWYSMPNSR